jgi:hypothetical protein
MRSPLLCQTPGDRCILFPNPPLAFLLTIPAATAHRGYPIYSLFNYILQSDDGCYYEYFLFGLKNNAEEIAPCLAYSFVPC